MDLEREPIYRAFRSRDARFDGRFFVGVVTTGIYCRPICPARRPKRENVEFYACAAAAEEAGFRACRRCRPETSPNTPAWAGTSATVSRALRLIAEGGLDGQLEADLADRLGLGERQLRRLFSQHLGASPVSVARTRRAHFARKLIDETDLPMARIAESSGFASIRGFNHEIRRAFGAPPTELRRKRPAKAVPENGSRALGLRLPFRPPLDWEMFLRYFGPRAIPGVESVDGDSYRRTIRAGDSAGRIEVSAVAGKPHLLLRVLVEGAPDLIRIVERVRRIFDLGADPREIARHLGRDPRLAVAVKARPGLRVPGAWDGFELAVREVSVRGATTLAGRLVQRYGELLPSDADDGLTHLFPRPEDVAEADLSSLGVPGTRAEAIRAMAVAVARGDLQLDASAGLEDAVERLSALPGIGPWTAGYIAMRALGEPDAIPHADLGLRRALADGARLASAAAVDEAAEAWRP